MILFMVSCQEQLGQKLKDAKRYEVIVKVISVSAVCSVCTIGSVFADDFVYGYRFLTNFFRFAVLDEFFFCFAVSNIPAMSPFLIRRDAFVPFYFSFSKQSRLCLATFPNSLKFVKNTPLRAVFSMSIEPAFK